MSVTIVDIANRAQVAPSTVSRALSGKGRIADDTRNKIVRLAQEMGYEGVSTTHKAIGIVYSRRLRFLIGDAFYGSIMESVEHTFRQWGYRVFFSTFDSQNDLAEMLDYGAHDGFIVVGGDVAPGDVQHLQTRAPIVLVDNEFLDHPMPVVVTANTLGSRVLTEHLLSLGHKKIAYVGGPLTHISLRQRVDGFKEVMAQAGLAVADNWIASVPEGHFGFETGVAGLRNIWVQRGLRPTAVLCSNDLVALGVLEAAHDLDIQVPDQLSVAGFDDVATGARPPLTTMKIHRKQLGQEAAHLLYDLISGRRTVPVKIVVYPTLTVRQSTAPPVAADERGEAHRNNAAT